MATRGSPPPPLSTCPWKQATLCPAGDQKEARPLEQHGHIKVDGWRQTASGTLGSQGWVEQTDRQDGGLACMPKQHPAPVCRDITLHNWFFSPPLSLRKEGELLSALTTLTDLIW